MLRILHEHECRRNTTFWYLLVSYTFIISKNIELIAYWQMCVNIDDNTPRLFLLIERMNEICTDSLLVKKALFICYVFLSIVRMLESFKINGKEYSFVSIPFLILRAFKRFLQCDFWVTALLLLKKFYANYNSLCKTCLYCVLRQSNKKMKTKVSFVYFVLYLFVLRGTQRTWCWPAQSRTSGSKHNKFYFVTFIEAK